MIGKKNLLLILMVCADGCVKAALPGIDPEVATILAGAADRVNEAEERATNALQQLAQHREEAEEALARAAQVAADAERFRLDNDVLLDLAAEQEVALRAAMERADEQTVTIAKLRKENAATSEQANDFLQKLQALTQQHEVVVAVHDRAQNALDQARKEKEQNDDEVRRLQVALASVSSSSFGIQRSGMPFGVRAQVNPMAVLNPSHVDKEQVEKDAVKKKLVTDLEMAIAGQKRMQDVVDEACTLVEEKEQEIVALTRKAVVLEDEHVALQKKNEALKDFKDATKAGYDYLDEDDINEAQVGAAAGALQPAMPPHRRQAVLDTLLIKLQAILDAAKSRITY